MTQGPYRGASSTDPDEPAPDPRGPWVLQTWQSRRECPNCDLPLFAAKKKGYRIDACGNCGGAWMAHEHAQHAISDRSVAPAILAELASKNRPMAPASAERKCPVCKIELVKERVIDAGVTLDVCAQHGAWFDPGEMRKVIEAMVRRNPLPVDPSVDAAIERERILGMMRPPENYQPGDRSVGIDVLGVLIGSAFNPDRRRDE